MRRQSETLNMSHNQQQQKHQYNMYEDDKNMYRKKVA